MVLINLIITAAQDQTIIKKNSTKGSFLYGTTDIHHNCGSRSNNHKKTALKVHSCMELLNFIITAAQDQTIIKNSTKGSLLYGTDESHHNCFPSSKQSIKKQH